ncbi:MAG: exodeoxyribonuclease VII small subunit [Anaerolineae bacterium]|jgi:exodeoxyribonuclease VII small subunit
MRDELEGFSFEQAFRDLEVTVQRLESGDLTLEEAIGLYEQGMRLAQACNDALDAAELRVEQLDGLVDPET